MLDSAFQFRGAEKPNMKRKVSVLNIWLEWCKPVARLAGLMAALAGAIVAADVSAQIIRPYSIRSQFTINGDIAQVGNSSITCPPSAACTAAQAGGVAQNNSFAGFNIMADGGAFGPTFNSSSADLAMPAGSIVRFAGLYWGGRANAASSRNQMLLKTPATGGYTTITAAQLDFFGTHFSAFADVTASVQAGGAGTYWGANVFTDITLQPNNLWGGWALMIIYESNTLPLRNLVVFDGYANITNATGVTVSLSGFMTPLSGPVTTKVGIFGFDGDFGFTGDQLQVRSSTNPTYTVISDAVNPPNDFYNSTISNGGVNVSTRVPNYINTLGIDLDRFTLPAGVVGNGATTADLLVNTGGNNICQR